MSADFPSEHRRELDEEGIPDLETPINSDEGMIPPRDHPQAVDEFGVTADEEREDEPLEDRLLREEPDVSAADIGDADEAVLDGQLLEPGSEDVDVSDDEKDTVARLVGEDETGLTAEEAAMHITDSP